MEQIEKNGGGGGRSEERTHQMVAKVAKNPPNKHKNNHRKARFKNILRGKGEKETTRGKAPWVKQVSKG